ncbi:hypothetical protein [Gimesia aquarii]|uniref:Uncharacterized protein n=1 Tax=Gimesia aquarii TaxID=2527964 RepID=A0A517WRG8_9PLAN|nr:hypothetical protein [Gimesia aquarii]QDU07855.1 hypothetical protein V202x_12160 [Gimesia aquarii]
MTAFTNRPVIHTLSMFSIGLVFSLSQPWLCADEPPLKNPDDNKIAKNEEKQDPVLNQKTKKELKKLNLGQQLPVELIIEEMKRAGKLLQDQQTGQQTQKIQQQVVENIQKLIHEIESASKVSLQQSNPKQDQPQNTKQKTQQQKDGMGQKKIPQPSQGPARQSSERQEKGLVTPGSLTKSNGHIKDTWGHLPPAVRQQLLNVYTEKFLPKYEEQVRRYYEALAEKKKRSP